MPLIDNVNSLSWKLRTVNYSFAWDLESGRVDIVAFLFFLECWVLCIDFGV